MADRKNKGLLDIKKQDLNVAKGELDSGMEHSNEISGDDRANAKAIREASRQHGDAFVVKSDLEDQDQRDAAPGTREQD
jgi:hypothetical protein